MTTALWAEPCHVYTHDAGPDGRMTFAALARYFQEAAWHSAEALGFGYREAMARKQFWVLVRQRIRMDRFPLWGDRIAVETWPRGVDGLWAFREYQVKDEDAIVIGGATSSWMIVDAETRRPVRPAIVAASLPLVIDRKALGCDASRIRPEGQWAAAGTRRVRTSDLDVNGHMNNSRYIDWVFDAVQPLRQGVRCGELEINYLAQSREGEEIAVHTAASGDNFYVKGVSPSDGQDVFIARAG